MFFFTKQISFQRLGDLIHSDFILLQFSPSFPSSLLFLASSLVAAQALSVQSVTPTKSRRFDEIAASFVTFSVGRRLGALWAGGAHKQLCLLDMEIDEQEELSPTEDEDATEEEAAGDVDAENDEEEAKESFGHSFADAAASISDDINASCMSSASLASLVSSERRGSYHSRRSSYGAASISAGQGSRRASLESSRDASPAMAALLASTMGSAHNTSWAARDLRTASPLTSDSFRSDINMSNLSMASDI